ncbi:MAG: hypothetical protein WAN82_03800 [Candidatus Bathyarchaeia archaeon]
MFTRKKKSGSNSGVIKSENSLLRLIRSDTGFQAFLISLERKDQEDAYNGSQKEIRNAMLEVEYKKAKAIMMMQQHRNFC